MGLLRIKPVLQAWARTLRGRVPSLSIEITKECPLRCPGCYAYEDAHLGVKNLRSLSDFRGAVLIARVLDLVNQHDPLHLSIVGGDPLVRYRELEVLLPQLVRRVHTQIVTSAFRPIPLSWAALPNLQIVVSIDGLQPEHDARRKPATYERILRNIEGHHVAVHCTITSAMVKRSGYIPEFVEFWSANSAVAKIWMSIFTPQRGADNVECLTVDERRSVVETLLRLRQNQRKLDMSEGTLKEFLSPPESPERCIFAQTTHTLSADLTTRVEPCQFGGDPDCARCGCVASMGLAAVGNKKLVGPIMAGDIFWASAAIGRQVRRVEEKLRRRINHHPDELSGESIPPAKHLLKVID
ncbi:MAG TPA: radical SAM protein [Terriglobales bacterium]|jgi:MoaA/NifB/PqqE/SkfB family radical SAM enzyme|nr:radical SAM protein [Terriglobales bacterium]